MSTTPEPRKKRHPGDLYVMLFRPHVEIRTPTVPWIVPGEPLPEMYKNPGMMPGPSTIRPSQPWRWLASVFRWLAFRCLLWAKASEAAGLREPEITERTILEALRELKAQAESFAPVTDDAAKESA